MIGFVSWLLVGVILLSSYVYSLQVLASFAGIRLIREENRTTLAVRLVATNAYMYAFSLTLEVPQFVISLYVTY